MARLLNLPPWQVEHDMPLQWWTRIDMAIEAENLAHEWAKKGW